MVRRDRCEMLRRRRLEHLQEATSCSGRGSVHTDPGKRKPSREHQPPQASRYSCASDLSRKYTDMQQTAVAARELTLECRAQNCYHTASVCTMRSRRQLLYSPVMAVGSSAISRIHNAKDERSESAACQQWRCSGHCDAPLGLMNTSACMWRE